MSGSVGTETAHVHIEAWPSTSLKYCRTNAISGSACNQKLCTESEVGNFTIDPADVASAPNKDEALSTMRLTSASLVDIGGVGPVKIGMTVAQAEEALGVPLAKEGVKLMVRLRRTQKWAGGIGFMVTNGQISRVDIMSCQFKTPEGAHIGSSEAEIQFITVRMLR